MHKLFLGMGLLLFAIFSLLIFSKPAMASVQGPVIYQVQVGGAGLATTNEELVSIYNNSPEPINISNWCLQYSTFSNGIDFTKIACFEPPSTNYKLILPSFSNAVIASNEFVAKQTATYVVDAKFNGGLISGVSGHIRLIDKTNQEIDRVGYDNMGSSLALHPESRAALFTPNITNNRTFQRIGDQIKQDTNDNLVDFSQMPINDLPVSDIFEERIPIDVCPNTPTLDLVVPVGYMQDTDGNCYEDVCDNITGLQKVVSSGYYRSGIDCHIVLLKINEVLPNVSGLDAGKEFIEIYNPTNYAVDLGGYQLQLGPSYSKNYPLPSVSLAGGEYVALSDSQTGITLPNSSASIKLLTPDGQTVDETDAYQDPDDDQAWAVLDGVWQYTNQPTSGSLNKESIAGGYGSGTTSLQPCPAGKYRNPATNRCRNINSGTSSLKPCRADQIRNPETNRCRSIFSASSGLKPCKIGQTRNPETNRCRKATSGLGLKACAINQVRNPETNRCRKKTSSEIAASEIKDIESKIRADHGGWLLAGTAGVGLAGYGVAEWRQEITLVLRRIRALLGKNPPDY